MIYEQEGRWMGGRKKKVTKDFKDAATDSESLKINSNQVERNNSN